MRENLHIETGYQTHNRPYFINKPCEVCKKPLLENDDITIAEIRDSVFRGDDEVYVMHEGCFKDSIFYKN